MSRELRTAAQGCIDQFKLLIEISAELDPTSDDFKGTYGTSWIEEQYVRFKIWAGNIGAFAEGHASLDYRLRDSLSTQKFMLQFLIALADFVHRAIVSLRPEETSEVLERIDSLTGANGSVGDASLDDSTSSAISSFQGSETKSVQDELTLGTSDENSSPEKRLPGIERAIDRLFRLSLLIRQPSRSSQNEKAERFIMKDDDGNEMNESFAGFARQIVDHCFPDASEFLRAKLSNGIVIRRKRFLYRRRHQEKLFGLDTTKETMRQDSKYSEQFEEMDVTVRASKVTNEVSPADTLAPKLLRLRDPNPSQTSASALQKQYLPINTVLEDTKSNQTTSFTATPSSSAPVELPRPPKPALGSKEFECPYCCLILPIKESRASHWRRHVLEDLEPYTCLFEGCPDDVKLFEGKASWIAHLQRHQIRWRCTSKAHSATLFTSEEEYFGHMRNQHAKSFTDSQLPLLANRSKVPATMIFPQCPLCSYIPTEVDIRGSTGASQTQKDRSISDRIIKHLAAHLESLAVKALPWQDEVEEHVEGHSQTGKADDFTVQSENGSRVLSSDDAAGLQFSEDPYDNTSIELPTRSGDTTPLLDSSYEEDWSFIERQPYFGHDRDETLQPLLQRLFLEDSTTNAFSGPSLPAYQVPVTPDRNFYGRDYALNAMEKALCMAIDDESTDNKPVSWPRCYALYGPGGMGKTQIAANFASKHRNEFDAVLWVQAEDVGKIAQDYKDLAIGLGLVEADSRNAMDLDYTKDVLKRWLVNPRKDRSQEGEKNPELASWLLVFDGVEDGDVLNGFWPYNGPGSVLITSRNPYSWSASLELKPFSLSEATNYLFRVTGKEPAPGPEMAAATTIANRLGGLPLALSQMGSIVASKDISFTDFLYSFEEREGSQAFFDWQTPDKLRSPSNYQSNVASVWAFDRLGKGSTLINIVSMLDPDSIPESVFTSPVEEDDSVLVQFVKTNYVAARTELLARSLITGNKGKRTLSVHRLVQDVARARLRQSEMRCHFLACVELINDRWTFQELTWRHGIARWETCEELFPHVQRLKTMYPSITPSPDSFDDYEFARLLIDSGWYQHERGQSLEAVYSNNMAQSICESLKLRLLKHPEFAQNSSVTLSKLNYSLLEIAHNRGCIALEINEPNDALRYLTMFNQEMVKESLKKNPEDMRLAISWNELGNAHMLNRDWKKGEECFLKSIEEMRKYHKFSETMISLPLANLGLAYWLQGNSELASSTLKKGLKDREDEFGKEDRVSFITGRFLHALGNVESSLDYHRRALMHYKLTLGNRHHRTADVFVKVAGHHIKLGNYDMALALLNHALGAFSISHTYIPEKMRACWMRSKALSALGKAKEAESELANCYQVYVRLRSKREGDGPKIKDGPSELDDEDIDDLIVFWSK
ncbi:unnamed protein product [Alternaria alternata]